MFIKTILSALLFLSFVGNSFATDNKNNVEFVSSINLSSVFGQVLVPVIPAQNLFRNKNNNFLKLDIFLNKEDYLFLSYDKNAEACIVKINSEWNRKIIDTFYDFQKDENIKIAYLINGDKKLSLLYIKGKLEYKCPSMSIQNILNNKQKVEHLFFINEINMLTGENNAH